MRTLLLLALITVSEATIGVFVKLTDGRIPVQTLSFYALAFAALFLLAVMPAATGRRLAWPRGNLRDTLLIGALIATQISVFNLAMTLTPIANAVIFWSVAPFFTFIFSALFLGERAKRSYVWIFGLALVGLAVANPLEGGYMVGNLVALGDGAIYAAMITYMRHEGKTEPGNDIAWSMLAAALFAAPALLLAGPGAPLARIAYPALGLELPVLLWAAGLGIVSTGFAYFGISIVLKRLSANLYALVDIIVSPVVASLLGFLILSETPSTRLLFGGALLLGAGFWLSRATAAATPAPLAVHPCQQQA
ncbi:MAG: EamA family transporter [Alphaproteobacteria bacterium]|nr:EamA family transporter [Alphaproteobacteria bacterium]